MQSHFLLPYYYAVRAAIWVVREIVGVLLLPWTGPMLADFEMPRGRTWVGFCLIVLVLPGYIIEAAKPPFLDWALLGAVVSFLWAITFWGRLYHEWKEFYFD